RSRAAVEPVERWRVKEQCLHHDAPIASRPDSLATLRSRGRPARKVSPRQRTPLPAKLAASTAIESTSRSGISQMGACTPRPKTRSIARAMPARAVQEAASTMTDQGAAAASSTDAIAQKIGYCNAEAA